ncbi:hypothetical protein LXL04_026520 [Taraxacum kok-saghyz]
MSGGIPYVISLKAVSSASSFSRSSAVGGKVPSSAPRACSAGVAILAAVVRTCDALFGGLTWVESRKLSHYKPGYNGPNSKVSAMQQFGRVGGSCSFSLQLCQRGEVLDPEMVWGATRHSSKYSEIIYRLCGQLLQSIFYCSLWNIWLTRNDNVNISFLNSTQTFTWLQMLYHLNITDDYMRIGLSLRQNQRLRTESDIKNTLSNARTADRVRARTSESNSHHVALDGYVGVDLNDDNDGLLTVPPSFCMLCAAQAKRKVAYLEKDFKVFDI